MFVTATASGTLLSGLQFHDLITLGCILLRYFIASQNFSGAGKGYAALLHFIGVEATFSQRPEVALQDEILWTWKWQDVLTVQCGENIFLPIFAAFCDTQRIWGTFPTRWTTINDLGGRGNWGNKFSIWRKSFNRLKNDEALHPPGVKIDPRTC